MTQFIALFIAVLKAVPILDKWYQESVQAYVKRKVLDNDKAFIASLDRARNIGDVTDLQRDIGRLLD